jgi:hypothetical protein
MRFGTLPRTIRLDLILIFCVAVKQRLNFNFGS